MLVGITSCEHLNDDRVPLLPVNIAFNTVADWDVHSGISGALTYRRFIRQERIPASFPWLASTYTGFGGVLLVGDIMGTPQAYDLACPVECRSDVRVFINEDAEYLAECPVCHSQYNVFSLYGHPISGEALHRGYALRRYAVDFGRPGIYAVVVSR